MSAPGFDRMPEVIDGASDFFYELFGPEFGRHARSAVGMAELPHGIPVEINGEFELRWLERAAIRSARSPETYSGICDYLALPASDGEPKETTDAIR